MWGFGAACIADIPVPTDGPVIGQDLLNLEAEEVVDAEIKRYQDHKLPAQTKVDLGTLPHDLLPWWKSNAKFFPYLAQVAQSLLAMSGSSGGLELDFCHSGRLISRHRGSLGPGMVEMVTCLAHLHDLIPSKIPVIPRKDGEAHIPARMLDPRLKELDKDDISSGDDFDDDDDDIADDTSL